MIRSLPFDIPLIGPVSTFSLLLMLAFLSASFLAPRELKRRGLNPEVADYSLLIAVVGAIVGSKLFFAVEQWHRIWYVDTGFWDTFANVFFTKNGMANPGAAGPRGQLVGLWPTLFSREGLVFYGGFIVAFSMLYAYLRYNKYDIWKYGDSYMPSFALAYAIGRLGCFVSGDGCFGFASGINVPFLTWVYGPSGGNCTPDPSAWWLPYLCTDGVRVWNTPVMEALASLALFAFLQLWARKQNYKPGMLVALFFIYNGLARFLVEFLRLTDAVIPLFEAPQYVDRSGALVSVLGGGTTAMPPASYFENYHWWGFTQAQIVGVLLIAVGLIWIFWRKLYRRETPTAA
ncbi:MAG: prolipoprotein diacylglyceryl transferase [Leptospirales bacterium]|nr:prolipoprotein diacylglyceryl transferase [Leptospirales bacterium]